MAIFKVLFFFKILKNALIKILLLVETTIRCILVFSACNKPQHVLAWVKKVNFTFCLQQLYKITIWVLLFNSCKSWEKVLWGLVKYWKRIGKTEQTIEIWILQDFNDLRTHKKRWEKQHCQIQLYNVTLLERAGISQSRYQNLNHIHK